MAQSRSDWQVYDRLAADPSIPPCHQLHYLQMACEKIASPGGRTLLKLVARAIQEFEAS
jgi:hypothetical protein